MMHNNQVVHADDANLDAWIASRPLVFVDAYADWCGPCKMFAPIFEEAAATYDAAFLKLDVESNPRTATRYGIRSIPTLLVFRNGELVDQVAGAMPKQVFFPFVKRARAVTA